MSKVRIPPSARARIRQPRHHRAQLPRILDLLQCPHQRHPQRPQLQPKLRIFRRPFQRLLHLPRKQNREIPTLHPAAELAYRMSFRFLIGDPPQPLHLSGELSQLPRTRLPNRRLVMLHAKQAPAHRPVAALRHRAPPHVQVSLHHRQVRLPVPRPVHPQPGIPLLQRRIRARPFLAHLRCQLLPPRRLLRPPRRLVPIPPAHSSPTPITFAYCLLPFASSRLLTKQNRCSILPSSGTSAERDAPTRPASLRLLPRSRRPVPRHRCIATNLTPEGFRPVSPGFQPRVTVEKLLLPYGTEERIDPSDPGREMRAWAVPW